MNTRIHDLGVLMDRLLTPGSRRKQNFRMQYRMWSVEGAGEYRMAATKHITKDPGTSQNTNLFLFPTSGRSVLPPFFLSFALKWGLTRDRRERVDGSVSKSGAH